MKKNETSTVFVTVRMPKDILDIIDEMAIEGMRSRSGQIIYLLKQMTTAKTEK